MTTKKKSTGTSPRTISIGGATYDLFVRTGTELGSSDKMLHLPLGGKIRVKQVVEACGGGASNTSVGLRRLGCAASFSGVVGDDQWGGRLLQNLEREGVDVRGATVVENETTSFSLILNVESGERVILYAAATNAHLQDPTFDREKASQVDWIYLNHLHEESCEIQDDLIAMLTKHPKMGLTWNPGGPQLKEGMHAKDNKQLLSQTDLLLLNKEEALAFTGEATADDAIRALCAAGAAAVCISDGARGAIASDGKTIHRCPVINDALVTDTTGAGDAFGTGMTWALLRGFDLPTALRAGTINATSVLAAIGAQAGLLTDIEMQKKLRTTHLDVTVTPL